MSRIGKKEIILPAGVNVEINNSLVKVSGPKGKLEMEINKSLTAKVENGQITISRTSETSDVKAKHGLYRSLVNNMVEGVAKGFSKKLVINGVGYKAIKQGNKLVLNIGFSHPVEIVEEEGIKISCPSITEIIIEGIDKQKVGQFASKIRDMKPVEPYHAYGIKYFDEVVKRKVGKKAAKGAKK